MSDSASFWAEIKALEDQLAKSPDSFCFAKLAEVYMKVGLIDDALHVSRQGSRKHPGYLSGLKVLAQACHAKGFDSEAMTALQTVTNALPEDVASQKLLGRLSVGTGNLSAARMAFRTALEFAPDDVECRIELESLERISAATEISEDEMELEEAEIIDELEVIEEQEKIEEDQPFDFSEVAELPVVEETVEPQQAVSLSHDPLSTSTLAELYVQQGFIHKALEIYAAKLADNPLDQVVAQRISELEAMDVPAMVSPEVDEEPETAEWMAEAADLPVDVVAGEMECGNEPPLASPVLSPEPEPMPMPEPAVSIHEPFIGFVETANPAVALQVPHTGSADEAHVLSTLDNWLENIGRIKSCR